MHDLRFPEVAIEVIAELYTDAITKIKLYFAETGPIKIERGTIQGDTLSPLLFLIFIEPLLRWLQSGGRGYKYGCLSKSLHADHTTSASAYADDMLATALSATDLARQAEETEAFVIWSGMAVNVKKCAVTGILWGQACRNGNDQVLSSKMLKMLQQRLETVKIYNTPIPFLHPHTEPYRCRGVDITPTFDWAPHLDRVLKEAKRKGERLLMSPLSTKQKAQALDNDNVIGSCMAYSMPLGLMTLSDVSKFDAIKLNICKRMYKLTRSTSSAMIHQDRERAGLGLTSMHVMYAKLTCTYLAKALNDKGPLGFVTRPMLMLQNEIIGESLKLGPSARYLRQTSHYHLARQLTVLQTSGLELTVPVEGHRGLRGNFLSSTLSKPRYDPCYLGLEQVIPPEIYHKLLEITDSFADLCLPNKQKVILLSTSELALRFGRVVTNQHKKALNQLTKLLNRYHLADIHGARFQNVGPLSVQHRIVVRPEIMSELRSRNTDHLDSREINDIECRALAMLREHSMLNPACDSRKSNKNKPCRREGHDTRTEKSPERSSNPTDDRISSNDRQDSSDSNTSAKGMDAEQTVPPGRCITLNRG